MSEAFLQMAGVFSQLELAMIRARVKSGMENAKAKGKRVGRRPTSKDDIPAIFHKHYAAFRDGKMNVSELARICGISRPTAYKYLKLIDSEDFIHLVILGRAVVVGVGLEELGNIQDTVEDISVMTGLLDGGVDNLLIHNDLPLLSLC